MARISRRTFIASAGALGSLWPAGSMAEPSYGPATLLILGAKVYTMDPQIPVTEAIAISGDRILALGSTRDIRKLASRGARVIDASGMTVTPGFIDAHSHPLSANEAVSVNVGFRQISKVQDALRARALTTPPGEWIFGHLYDDTKFEGGKPVTRADLDEVSREHPIFVLHRGGHTAVVSSKAFERAGVTATTPDPQGGKLFRDSNGFTGRIAEKAFDLFAAVGARPTPTRRQNQEGALLASKRMASAGLTSTTDAGGGMEELLAYQDAYAAGALHCRISFMPIGSAAMPGEKSAYERLKELGMRSGFGDAMLRIGAVKYYADGSASERTMRMSTAYAGRPDDHGILTMTQQEIDAAVDDAATNGFRIGIHANGDVAIAMVLDAYERVLRNRQGANPRWRIEHCTLVNPDLLTRIKNAGAVPTPFYSYVYYHGEKWREYGDEKLEWMFAHRSFLDYGIPVAPASDYIAGPYEPLMAIQSMVTRKDMHGKVWGARQRISVSDALKICTAHGAYASFEEDIKGSLTPGKLADITVLERDPHSTDPDSIKDIRVMQTLLGGKVTHEA